MTKIRSLFLVAALFAPLSVSAGVTIDSEGWTRVTPSSDSLVLYVSSSSGNDANAGTSAAAPKQTIAAALALTRDGYPDHVRLKRGDTFIVTNPSGIGAWINGRSKQEPAVFTHYGESGPRPVLKIVDKFAHPDGKNRNYQAFIGLDFYNPASDPTNTAEFANVSSTKAMRMVGGGADLLIEDCRFRYCNVSVESYGGNFYTNLQFRRNIVLDNWTRRSYFEHGGGVGNVQGLYLSNLREGYLLEENFFDHNGWSEVVPEAGANMFNHNIYIQYSNVGGGIIRGNILARGAAHGIQARSGGLLERNLFVLNAVSLNFGGVSAPTQPDVLTYDNRAVQNVVLNGRRMDPANGNWPRTTAVWGITVSYVGEVDAIDNIIANRIDDGNNVAFNTLSDQPPASFNLTNNIVYNWQPAADTTNSAWPHPDADLGDFHASIGGANSTTAYLDVLRDRPLGSLPWDMTAYAAINYIREGFNKAPVTGYYSYNSGAPTNVAKNKSVTVSSYESGTTNNGAKLVDGNTNASASRWSAQGYPQWALVDLGAAYDLSEVRVHPYQNRAYRYTVEAGMTPGSYVTIVNRSTNTTGGAMLNDTVGITARYVRITVTGASGYTGGWTSLGELELYGKAATGGITRDYWTGMSGSTLAHLTGDSRFPSNPTGSDRLQSLEAVSWTDGTTAQNWGDNYGQRIHGFLKAPTTGAYTFWISGDDHCALELSTDANPANAQTIASVSGFTSRRQWNKYTSQKSAPVTLQAGQTYYIEVRHKEQTGGDSVSVGWAKPGQSTSAPSEVIPGAVLSP